MIITRERKIWISKVLRCVGKWVSYLWKNVTSISKLKCDAMIGLLVVLSPSALFGGMTFFRQFWSGVISKFYREGVGLCDKGRLHFFRKGVCEILKNLVFRFLKYFKLGIFHCYCPLCYSHILLLFEWSLHNPKIVFILFHFPTINWQSMSAPPLTIES